MKQSRKNTRLIRDHWFEHGHDRFVLTALFLFFFKRILVEIFYIFLIKKNILQERYEITFEQKYIVKFLWLRALKAYRSIPIGVHCASRCKSIKKKYIPKSMTFKTMEADSNIFSLI